MTRTASKSREELDEAVVERCRRGDPLALHAFVVRYQDAVFAVVSRIAGREAGCEDLAQEVFLRAFRALPGFDPSGPARVSTWLLTIAARLAIDARRKQRGFEPLDDALASEAPGPYDELRRGEVATELERALDGLTTEQRAAFVLTQFHGRSLSEAAEMLGIPEATVKTRVFRAREKLRRWLLPLIEEGVS